MDSISVLTIRISDTSIEQGEQEEQACNDWYDQYVGIDLTGDIYWWKPLVNHQRLPGGKYLRVSWLTNSMHDEWIIVNIH